MDFEFDRARHDRSALRRSDDLWRKDPSLKVMLVGSEYIATTEGPAISWLDPDDAPPGEWILLGESGHGLRGAVLVGQVPEEYAPISMRVLAPLLDAEQASFAVHAIAIGRWLQSHTYCSRCGDYLYATKGGHLLNCPQCGAEHYPRCDPAAIMLVTDADDRVLLARNQGWPEGRFSTLAGFVEPGESVEDAVRREVAEEVGVRLGEVRYVASQPWPFPSSLMLGFTADAETTDIRTDDDEIAEADWFSRDEVSRYLEAGTLILPPKGVSISRHLIDTWLD